MKDFGIYPRNLTARLAYQAAGNPIISRLEDVVGNCFPGLEVDVRNLDRRFFPGLVFNFAGREHRHLPPENPQLYGARLVSLEYESDPDLDPADPVAQPLLAEYHGPKGLCLTQGEWFLEALIQAGKRIEMSETDASGERVPLDGMTVWRLVRSLEPGPVTICLGRRDQAVEPIELHGWRRVYVDPVTGVLNEVFQPGELLQSLCSPWQHDFRDCACMYWASNRPDVVFGKLPEGEAPLPGGQALDPERAALRLDWLRSERGPAGEAFTGGSYYENRPYQMDPHELNTRWAELDFVLEEHEIDGVYRPPRAPATAGCQETPGRQGAALGAESGQVHEQDCPFGHTPAGHHRDDPSKTGAGVSEAFDGPETLAMVLRQQLAPMELALALEYLYAHFSVRSPDEIDAERWPDLPETAALLRRRLLMISIGEMAHLRWANQILWELHRCGLVSGYEPALTPATRLPRPAEAGPSTEGFRPGALRPLTPEVLADFIAVERPSGFLDGAYARVIATLKDPRYPRHLYQLAVRIDADGIDHFSRFREVARMLERYAPPAAPPPYLRPIHPGTPGETRAALNLYSRILESLLSGFQSAHEGHYAGAEQQLVQARDRMTRLQAEAEALARQGIGIPYFDFR